MRIGRASISPDGALAVLVAGIVVAMVAPLPAWALDLGIALNLAGSVGLLVVALQARDPLRVTVFPTFLLISTLFRLSLNVSSTRLALAEGHAGHIIQTFGDLVVRGDYWVGAALFGILSVVQFLVVAKGAERVAEVSARFTLDAMPGKQMAIDADVRAGLMDAAQAQLRRRALERESQMFGAMDGAMKFIKGDVVASLIIVAVNLFAGTLIGVMHQGRSIRDAAAMYALIAVGDGLASQVGSLCVALAAGLLVTRVGSEDGTSSLGTEITRQLLGEPRPFRVVAGLCAGIAFLPGMPAPLFLTLALVLGVFSRLTRSRAAPAPAPALLRPAAGSGAPARLSLELSADLSAWVEADQGRWVKGPLEEVRESLYQEMGLRVPALQVRVRVPGLGPGQYCLLLDGTPLSRGALALETRYAHARAEDLLPLGIQGTPRRVEWPAQPLCSVHEKDSGLLLTAGIRVSTALDLLAEHVRSCLRRHAARLLGLQEVRNLMDDLEASAPVLIQETLQKVPLPLLAEVLRQLLEEQVSVRNLQCICEALASPTTEGDVHALVERCRQALRGYISHRYAPEGPLYAFLVDPAVEELLRGAGRHGGLEPDAVNRILEKVRELSAGGVGVLLTSPDTRRTLRRLCEGAAPDVAVLTYLELNPELQIRTLGRLAC